MKRAFVILSIFMIAACSSLPKADKAILNADQPTAVPKGTSLAVDTAATTVRFTGHGVGQNHSGIFKLAAGSLWLQNQTIAGGQFTINIASMQLEEKGALIEHKLRPHLLSADFFDAATYPTATFVITSVHPLANGDMAAQTPLSNYLVSGNLTLKNVTKNISFPAQLHISETAVSGTARFNIDRTWWGMSYGGDRSLGNKFISPMVTIQLRLKTQP